MEASGLVVRAMGPGGHGSYGPGAGQKDIIRRAATQARFLVGEVEVMGSIVRSVLAVLAGFVAGGVLTFAIQMINHLRYPPPADFDWSNSAHMKACIDSLTLTAFLTLLLSYAVGTFTGAWLTVRIARRAPWLHGLIIGALFLAAGIYNLVTIPYHPAWFAWVVQPLYIAMALAGTAAARNTIPQVKP
jgi:hypothetical protein